MIDWLKSSHTWFPRSNWLLTEREPQGPLDTEVPG
uniref:Uncharacterized protein n=1 Tax=Anguilla anguilla TaxID=7936 RepID=A0A0E9WFK0_ANGAN